MDLVTLCPFVASKVVWQAHSGAFALTVIVKATFVLHPGTSQLAPKQDPICEDDQFHEEDPRRSLRVPSDVVPYKPRADVMLVGHAYAPNKQLVRSVVTRFVVGDMDKSIEVWCDRAFRVLDGQLLEGKRFTEMPLVWERASGGPESANPVGKRFDGAMDAYGTIAIGNLQPPGHFVSKRSDTFVPTCYGPVAATWPGRTQRLNRLSRTILDRAWNAQKLPAELDPLFFQAAPTDQQVAEIRANERIVLENLQRDHARLVTSLPGLMPRAIADRATGEREEIKLVGDTLWVDADRGICCVVWRGRIGLRHPQEAGRIAIWVDGLPMTAPVQPEVVEDALELITTMVPKTSQEGPALPFVAGASSLAQQSVGSEPATDAVDEDEGTGTMFVLVEQLGVKATPFEQQGNVGKGFDAPIAQPSTIATPFVVPTAVATPAPEPPAFVASPYANERIGWGEPVVSPEIPPPIEVESVKKEEVAPPAMIGPLARGEVPPTEEAKVEESAPVAPEVVATPVEVSKEFNPADFPLERCAALTASIARAKPNKGKLLEEEKLTEGQWEAIQEYWNGEIKAETRRGKATLLHRFDEAYVGQLEKERGPITVEEYAMLSVAAERGTLDEVLQELELPRGANARIERIWLRILAADFMVAERVVCAVSTFRDS